MNYALNRSKIAHITLKCVCTVLSENIKIYLLGGPCVAANIWLYANSVKSDGFQ